MAVLARHHNRVSVYFESDDMIEIPENLIRSAQLIRWRKVRFPQQEKTRI